MEINKCKYRLRCEMGACGKRAQFTLQPTRVGIRSSVHICEDCLSAIVDKGKSVLGISPAAAKKPKKAAKTYPQISIDDLAATSGESIIAVKEASDETQKAEDRRAE